MADSLNWGILATGNIARQFANGLKKSKTGKLVAVGSRTKESSAAFAEKFGGKPYGSYQAVLEDPNVQAVYVATPHHMHYEWTIKCAEAGKAILCEKPFTLNAIEAKRALNEVRAHKVFFMEAFMYRCHPQTHKALEIVKSAEFGELLMIQGDFGFAASKDWTNFRADGALGGGGLMDVGTYCVSFARYLAQEEPDRLEYTALINARGYDEKGAGIMHFPTGLIAYFGTGVHVNLRNDAIVYGANGTLHIPNPWKCADGGMTLRLNGKEPELIDLKSTNDELYALEADTVAEFIDRSECPYMTVEDTIANMAALDALRKSAGLKFASEMTV